MINARDSRCVGALSSRQGRSTVSTLTSQSPVMLSYFDMVVSNTATARVTHLGSFVMSVNCDDDCTTPQWESWGVINGTMNNVSATVRGLDVAPWGGLAPLPGIDITAMPSGLLRLTSEGPLIFDHVPSFSYSDEVVSVVETSQYGPYCVSDRMCEPDAWQGGYDLSTHWLAHGRGRGGCWQLVTPFVSLLSLIPP